MSQLVLKVVHENWGEIGPGDWARTIWRVYGYKCVEREDIYEDAMQNRWHQNEVSEDGFRNIMKNIDAIKNEKDFTDADVDALDGSAWSFAEYENGRLIWFRDLSYIYGIKSLESISKILNKENK